MISRPSKLIFACSNIFEASTLCCFNSCTILSLYSIISVFTVYCSDKEYFSAIPILILVSPKSCSLIFCSICQMCFFWIRWRLKMWTRRKSRFEFVVIFSTSTSSNSSWMSSSTFSVGNTTKKLFAFPIFSNLTTPVVMFPKVLLPSLF